jgi:predicted GNAT family N-acyltransferase
MSEIEFKEVAFGTAEYDATVSLRDVILRTPLGLTFDPEAMAAEVNDYHLAAVRDGELIACLVLTPQGDGDIKMRQVAVAERAQRTGIGTTLVKFSEEFALRHGYRRMTMHARDTAVPFYTRLGYEVYDEPFTEVTIPHRKMRKVLTDNG